MDDRNPPLTGVIIGHEDEDRVQVAWGDEQFNNATTERPANYNVVYEDELIPYVPADGA